MKFLKMHGLGNDYIYINNLDNKVKNYHDLAIKLSDRHFGIGGDGIILICESKVADFRMRIFNADGSEAEMCGNGIRCVGKYVYDKGLTCKSKIKIETKAGIKELLLKINNNKVVSVTVDMDEPILSDKHIPVIHDFQKTGRDGISFSQIKRKIDNYEFLLTCVSMGNPHAVVFLENISDLDVKKYGEILENDPCFPERANIEFAEIIDKKTIKMRVWERGSGETLACGTGACATMVAAYLNGYINKKVTVILRGGSLKIEWKKNNHIYMTGDATMVFEGEIK